MSNRRSSLSNNERNTKNTKNHKHQNPLSRNETSATTTECSITKVIYAHRIIRFASRTVKDLVIINSVCNDFEETMQAHRIFNLVLYDNIIKKRKREHEFFARAVELLKTAPAWIVYQWTIVNEHDEQQRELLKEVLLYQAKDYENKILIRENVIGEDPSITRDLLYYIIDSCVKLGIAKEVLEACTDGWNCATQAIYYGVSADSFELLLESCIQYGVDMKRMLEQNNRFDGHSIMIAARFQCPFESFKLLLESCIQHGVDLTKMMEHINPVTKSNCLSLSTRHRLNVDSLRLLIAHFPSNESFSMTLAAKNHEKKRAVALTRVKEVKVLLEDPDCWKKCREWCISNGISFPKGWSVSQRAGQESGKRRERE